MSTDKQDVPTVPNTGDDSKPSSGEAKTPAEQAPAPIEQSQSAGQSSTPAEPIPEVQTPPEPPKVKAPYPYIVGIDFGTQKIVITKVSAEGGAAKTVQNETSDFLTANLITFSDEERLVGENARSKATMYPANSVPGVTRLLGRTVEEISKIDYPFKFEPDNATGNALLKFPYGESGATFTPEQIAAMVFKRLQKYIDKSITSDEQPIREASLAVPPSFSPTQAAALRNAALIAGFNVVEMIPQHTAVAVAYGVKNQIDSVESTQKTVVFVDIGSVYTWISLAKFTKGKVEVLAVVHDELGGSNFDRKLMDFTAQRIKKDIAFDVHANPRYVERLRVSCEKTKLMLSTIKEAEFVYSAPEQDAKFFISAAQFEELCAAELARAKSLVEKFVNSPGVDKNAVDAIEIVGGGTRVPFVQTILEEAFGKKLSRGLDSASSVALGAATYAALVTPGFAAHKTIVVEDPTFSNPRDHLVLKPEELQKYQDVEQEMTARDFAIEQRAKSRNDLESFVFKFKEYLTSPNFATCFDDQMKHEISAKLSEASSWLDDTADDKIETSVNHQKLLDLEASVKSLAPKLFEKLDEIEKERAKAAAEAAAAMNKPSTKTRDNKPLNNPQKLEEANARKEHGNKLFVDLDYINAIRRYTQALELLQTMFDENPSQKEEADKIKLSCYLNLASCLVKANSYNKAIENCKLALQLDPQSAKALFRRGQAYFETKEYEKAHEDLLAASKLMPKNKEIREWYTKANTELTRQKNRQKKMYAAMFGGSDSS